MDTRLERALSFWDIFRQSGRGLPNTHLLITPSLRVLLVCPCSYNGYFCLGDADFNLHMSNSSYAKALDSASASRSAPFRMFSALAEAAPSLPPTKKAKSDKNKTSQSQENGIASELAIASGVAAALGDGKETFIPALTTPAMPLDVSGSGTPLNGANGGADGANANGTSPDAVSRALLECAVRTTEPDGTLLYREFSVSVSQLCYKQGRITIPPAIVFAANGFYAAPETASTTSTSTSTSSTPAEKKTAVHPPHWPAVRTVTQSMCVLAKFYAGGWRDVPEGERWWVDAFAACEYGGRSGLCRLWGPNWRMAG
ncbi:hypothetical protein K438DRAFT_2020662 [Mycena galopus ATCC 62051]|nr:hypothetical protein K438DRAFT_2020662 [Mycena galopus ATCC 62051]